MRVLITLLLLALPLRAAADSPVLPDPKLTPGVINPKLTQAVLCSKKFTTRDERHTTLAQKKEVFRRYKIPWERHAGFEVDHLISLEIGGADQAENFWPEAYCKPGNVPTRTHCYGAREKDKIETRAHALMCKGKYTLAQVQDYIRHNWVAFYKLEYEQ